MALNDIKDGDLEELQPQVETYVDEILQKVGVLVGQSVKRETLELKQGRFSDYFKRHQKTYMLTKMGWDGKEEGRLFYLCSIELAIVLTSFMMGTPAPSIAAKAQAKEFEPEFKEAYGEVSNQLWGNLNQLLIAKIDSNIHLSMQEAPPELPENGSANSNIEDLDYLFITIGVQVGDDLDPYNLTLMISTDFVNDIYAVNLGGAAGSAGGANFAGGLDAISAEQAMIKPYPVIQIGKSVGDALDLMEDSKLDCLPVIEDGKVVRMISKNNIEIIRSVFFDAPGQEERVSRLMCIGLSEVNKNQKLVSAQPSTNLKMIAKQMVKHNINSVPVVSETGEFEGLVTVHRIMEMLSQDSE